MSTSSELSFHDDLASLTSRSEDDFGEENPFYNISKEPEQPKATAELDADELAHYKEVIMATTKLDSEKLAHDTLCHQLQIEQEKTRQEVEKTKQAIAIEHAEEVQIQKIGLLIELSKAKNRYRPRRRYRPYDRA